MAHLAHHYSFSHNDIMAMSLNWIFKYYANSFSLPYYFEKEKSMIITNNNNFTDWVEEVL